MKKLFVVALVAIFVLVLAVAAADAQQAKPKTAAERTPSVNGLTEKQMTYQLSVWAFLIMLVMGLIGFSIMLAIDYSDDNMLNAAPSDPNAIKADAK
jgi:hypothetical protein